MEKEPSRSTQLFYKPDFDETRDRLTTWWNGGDLGRPALQLTVPRAAPIEDIKAMPEPEGWVTHYSTRDFDYRVNVSARACVSTHYLCEAIPVVLPDLAPNCLALYLGCQGVEMPDTVWCRPCFDSPETARFERDDRNFYWDFTLRLARAQLRIGACKFMTGFPDLIEGLDTLAAMRGTEYLLADLVERPEWVHDCLNKITDIYFSYYDELFDLIQCDRGGSHFWAWAPGRMCKLQCDFSAMISPEMFKEFMNPVLCTMTERLDYSMYHWDGPGAISHLDNLLSIPRLNMIQWTPGAGVEPVMDRRWWPLYHRMVDGSKKPILMGFAGLDNLRGIKKEFGDKLKQFMIQIEVDSLEESEEVLRIVSD